MLPTLLGHLETFQRHLFAGCFDNSIYLKNFEIDQFIKNLGSPTIDSSRLAAYRGVGASSIGFVLADTLSGWHDAKRVNQYFKAFPIDQALFSNQFCKSLDVLWQLRHAIVHTGGTLTIPDSQKNKQLAPLGRTQIAFENGFIWQISKKMHKGIKSSVDGYGVKYLAKIKEGTPEEAKEKICRFFEVTSTNKNFFK